jgi:hypothetical protein
MRGECMRGECMRGECMREECMRGVYERSDAYLEGVLVGVTLVDVDVILVLLEPALLASDITLDVLVEKELRVKRRSV